VTDQPYETLEEFRKAVAKRKAHRMNNPYLADITLRDLVSSMLFVTLYEKENKEVWPYKADTATLVKIALNDADVFLSERLKHLEST
jgi:hypothetical protein